MTPSRWDMDYAVTAWPGWRRGPSPLVLPRAHDCITLLMGSRTEFERYFQDHPGVYYRSTGWVERGADLESPWRGPRPAYYPGNKEGHIPTRSASEGPMKSLRIFSRILRDRFSASA